MHVWIGARNADDVPYGTELAGLAAQHPQVAVRVVFSASDNSGSGPRWIHEALREALAGQAAFAEYEFYVCGPPAMLDATRAVLDESGIPPDRIAFDQFGG